MKGYTHRGLVGKNGVVDTSLLVTDASSLEVLPSDDGFHVRQLETGDFEWWYFDIIDLEIGCVLRLAAHIGTDPLKRKIFPQLAISVKTPNIQKSLLKPYSLSEFSASQDICNVRLSDEFQACFDSFKQKGRYKLSVNTNEFSADLTFFVEIEGWKPLGNEFWIEKGKKRGAFSWIIPAPKAKVSGNFSFMNERYVLKDAIGYHDHNYWKVDSSNKLFIDNFISKWYWGRFRGRNYTIIFMDTHFRKHSITSFMLAKDNDIIHSSNNLIEVLATEMRVDEQLRTAYPARITVRSIAGDNSFTLVLNSKEIIEKKDLLDGVDPLLKGLIKSFVSKPAYYAIWADAALAIENKEILGSSVYEYMLFRTVS
ncbi:MAG: hypothetical protein FVQ79_09020 [Planctomycetes bacterium]|nr:hypothetical protein [Planctomycetota bacterium]